MQKKKFIEKILADENVSGEILATQPFIEEMVRDALPDHTSARHDLAEKLSFADIRFINEDKFLKATGTAWKPFDIQWYHLTSTVLQTDPPGTAVSDDKHKKAAKKNR